MRSRSPASSSRRWPRTPAWPTAPTGGSSPAAPRLRDLAALPASPETVAAYLASTARLTNQTGEWLYAPSTLGRRLAAIAKAHQLAGLASPCRDPQVSTTLAASAGNGSGPPGGPLPCY